MNLDTYITFYSHSPKWFLGIDSFIEAFIVIIALIIAIYSYKVFKFSQNKNYFYLTLSFLLISISYLFKIVTDIAYITIEREIQLLLSIFLNESLVAISSITIIIHKLLLIVGLLIALYLTCKKFNYIYFIIISFFIILLTFTLYSYQLFLLLTFTINLVIVLNLTFFNKKPNSILSLFFIYLTITYFILFLTPFIPVCYVLGHLALLVSYLILLFTLIKIFRK